MQKWWAPNRGYYLSDVTLIMNTGLTMMSY